MNGHTADSSNTAPQPTATSVQKKVERIMKVDIEDHFQCSPEYALDRYIMALFRLRERYPDAEFPPFIGDTTFKETLDSLPKRLVDNVAREIAWCNRTYGNEGIALNFYNRCRSWLEKIDPESCNLLPEFREMLPRAHFGSYGRDGKPRFSQNIYPLDAFNQNP